MNADVLRETLYKRLWGLFIELVCAVSETLENGLEFLADTSVFLFKFHLHQLNLPSTVPCLMMVTTGYLISFRQQGVFFVKSQQRNGLTPEFRPNEFFHFIVHQFSETEQ